MRVKTGNVVMRVAFERQKVIPRSLENRNFCKREIRNFYHLCVQGTEYMGRLAWNVESTDSIVGFHHPDETPISI